MSVQKSGRTPEERKGMTNIKTVLCEARDEAPEPGGSWV